MTRDAFKTLLVGLLVVFVLSVVGLFAMAFYERDVPDALVVLPASLLTFLGGLFVKNPLLTSEPQEVEVINKATEPIPVIPPGTERLGPEDWHGHVTVDSLVERTVDDVPIGVGLVDKGFTNEPPDNREAKGLAKEKALPAKAADKAKACGARRNAGGSFGIHYCRQPKGHTGNHISDRGLSWPRAR